MRFSSRLLKDWLRASALGVFGYGAALLPLKRNKIVFCSYYGKGFGDNGRYLVDEIQRQNLEVDIVWLLSKSLMPNAVLPEGVRRVMYGSLRSAFELATAGIWVDNSRKFIAPPKRRGQFYIQTWHGGLGVKCVEQAAQDKLTQTYVRLAKRDAQMTDLMVSNGGYITRVFNTNFWYSGPILEKGFPRNDILF